MDIGQLEAVVLGVVKRQGKASAREVLKEIVRKRKIAYTSISTTLDRLFKKGLLMREATIGKGGQKYIYFFRENQEIEKRIVDRFLNTLVSAFGPAVISSISERLDELSKEETEKLRSRISEKRTLTE